MTNFKIPKLFKATEPVFVVGGGFSLRDFDFSLLEGKQVVAVNTAFKKVKNADIMYFCDADFVKQWGDVSGKHFWRFKGKLKLTVLPKFQGMNNIECMKVKGVPFSTDPEFLPELPGTKLNAGAQAINVAYLAGGRKIVLLGFDMCKVGAQNNWHTETKLQHHKTTDRLVYDKYRQAVEEMADYIKENDIKCKIFNCSEISKLECFPKEKLSKFLPV